MSLLNYVVSDGSTLIATRFVRPEAEGAATLYYAEGGSFDRQEQQQAQQQKQGTASAAEAGDAGPDDDASEYKPHAGSLKQGKALLLQRCSHSRHSMLLCSSSTGTICAAVAKGRQLFKMHFPMVSHKGPYMQHLHGCKQLLPTQTGALGRSMHNLTRTLQHRTW